MIVELNSNQVLDISDKSVRVKDKSCKAATNPFGSAGVCSNVQIRIGSSFELFKSSLKEVSETTQILLSCAYDKEQLQIYKVMLIGNDGVPLVDIGAIRVYKDIIVNYEYKMFNEAYRRNCSAAAFQTLAITNDSCSVKKMTETIKRFTGKTSNKFWSVNDLGTKVALSGLDSLMGSELSLFYFFKLVDNRYILNTVGYQIQDVIYIDRKN